jgi:molybdopterin converting factor small subunit
MTVWDLILDQGFRERDAEAIAAIINDAQGDRDDVLADGDNVELLVSISGG